jgi:hypothetical protein
VNNNSGCSFSPFILSLNDVSDGQDRYMTVDLSVSCSSDKYYFGKVWAIISIFVYPIGIPLYYFYVLYDAREDIKCRSDLLLTSSSLPSLPSSRSSGINAFISRRVQRLQPIKLLFEAYKPELWYWEVVETGRRLMLTGVLVLIAQGSAVQIIVGMALALFYLKLYDSWQPYTDPVLMSVEAVSEWQILFVFFLALLLKADFGSVSRTALGVLLVLTIFANFLIDAGRAIVACSKRKMLSDSGCRNDSKEGVLLRELSLVRISKSDWSRPSSTLPPADMTVASCASTTASAGAGGGEVGLCSPLHDGDDNGGENL